MASIYDQNIVVDFEFAKTTKKAAASGLIHEIIQIGAVRVSPEGDVLDTYSQFVQPDFAINIDTTVKELTGICWSDVRDAEHFSDAMEYFVHWVGEGRTRFVAWSPSDYEQLVKESRTKQAQLAITQMRWLDLQKVYPCLLNVGKRRGRMSLKTASEWCGVNVTKDLLHEALYDARVTAELLRQAITGEYLSQKQVLSDLITPPEKHETLTSSLGSRFADLAKFRDLLAVSA